MKEGSFVSALGWTVDNRQAEGRVALFEDHRRRQAEDQGESVLHLNKVAIPKKKNTTPRTVGRVMGEVPQIVTPEGVGEVLIYRGKFGFLKTDEVARCGSEGLSNERFPGLVV